MLLQKLILMIKMFQKLKKNIIEILIKLLLY